MKFFTIVEYYSGPKAKFYSIQLSDRSENEFDAFVNRYQNPESADYSQDYEEKVDLILDTMEVMANELGAYHRFFKPEGSHSVFRFRINDDDTHPLRSYCLKYGGQIVVLGNGGKKELNTVTYQDKDELYDAVKVLRAVDQALWENDVDFTDLDSIINIEFELKGL